MIDNILGVLATTAVTIGGFTVIASVLGAQLIGSRTGEAWLAFFIVTESLYSLIVVLLPLILSTYPVDNSLVWQISSILSIVINIPFYLMLTRFAEFHKNNVRKRLLETITYSFIIFIDVVAMLIFLFLAIGVWVKEEWGIALYVTAASLLLLEAIWAVVLLVLRTFMSVVDESTNES
ncbi:MAG: hypothetical protein HN764_17595 [Gammaproteobacteria bacterium]|jgi:hypothetical protein|nr:hypothetical protein [Gammaproteobacteria bacterium]